MGGKRYRNTPRKAKDAMTTGQIADLCGVAPRTVSAWIDNGKLPGWRIPSGNGGHDARESHDRRVATPVVIAFLRRHGMPVPDDLRQWEPSLLVTVSANGLGAKLRAALPAWWAVAECDDLYTLGRTHCPALTRAVVVDVGSVGTTEAMRLGECLVRDGRPRRLVAVLPEGGLSVAPTEYGYTDCLEYPVNVEALAALVSE